MPKMIAVVLGAGAVIGAGIWLKTATPNARPTGAPVALPTAAPSAQPAAAQGNLWVTIAVSPSKLDYGGAHALQTQADSESAALQECRQQTGATDCKIVESGAGECAALAITPKGVPDHYGGGSGATRETIAAEALAECAKSGGSNCVTVLAICSSDDPRWASPLPLPAGGQPGSVDPSLVGLWKLDVGSGIWVWQISANGTYTFHSEALDGTGPHAGTFTASKGKYTLHAQNINWDDQGTYTMQGSGAVSMTGKLGTGTWSRITSAPDP